MKFDIEEFFETLARKLKFDYYLKRLTGTSDEDVCTYRYFRRRRLYIQVLQTRTFVHTGTSDEDVCTYRYFRRRRLYINI